MDHFYSAQRRPREAWKAGNAKNEGFEKIGGYSLSAQISPLAFSDPVFFRAPSARLLENIFGKAECFSHTMLCNVLWRPPSCHSIQSGVVHCMVCNVASLVRSAVLKCCKTRTHNHKVLTTQIFTAKMHPSFSLASFHFRSPWLQCRAVAWSARMTLSAAGAKILIQSADRRSENVKNAILGPQARKKRR